MGCVAEETIVGLVEGSLSRATARASFARADRVRSTIVRIFLELLDSDGDVTRSAVFDALPVMVGALAQQMPQTTWSSAVFDALPVMVGEGERNDFQVEGLEEWGVQIEEREGRLVVRCRGQTREVDQSASIVLGKRTVRITVLRDAAVPGACPRCGGGLSAQEVGGAYRAIAREEQGCRTCGVSVLAIDEAAWEIGAFSERARDEWVHVAVTMRCPRCVQPMMRVFFRTEAGEADVERCIPCGTVVIGPEDRARLAGA